MENCDNATQVSTRFDIDSKSWFLTWPQCPLTKEHCLTLLRAKRTITAAVVSRELHEDGSPHLHAYVLLERRYRVRNPRFWDLESYHGNYQSAKSVRAVVGYIKKDGDILEFGDIDWSEKVASHKDHRRYLGKRIIQGEPLEDIVRDDPSLIFGLTKLSQDVLTWKSLSLKIFDKPDVRGLWIYGPPRVGKSYYVRQNYPSLYLKAQNKWWDGYQGEAAVLIDDLDSDCLSHYLKIWADRYGCTGEVKGGHTPLVYDEFIVTSNFSIEELFKDKPPVTIEAISRRFRVIHMTDRNMGLNGYRAHRSSRRSRSADSN